MAFALAVTVFSWRLSAPAPWLDEGVTLVTLGRDWGQLMALWQGADAPLFVYYVLLKLWAGIAGLLGLPMTITVLRSFSVLCAALAVVVCGSLVARHAGRTAGVVAAALLTVLPGMSRYAQEARPTALLLLATAVAWWAFDRWAHPSPSADGTPGKPKARHGVLWAAALVAGPLISLFGFLQWAAIGLALLPTLWALRNGSRPLRRALILLSPLVSASVIVVLPALHIASLGVGPQTSDAVGLAGMAVQLAQVPFGSFAAMHLGWLIGLTLMLLLAALASLLPGGQRTELTRSAWLWLLVPLAGGLLIGAVHPAFIRVRYWMPLVLPAAVLVALGLHQVALWLQRPGPASNRPWAKALPIVLLALLAVGCFPSQARIRDADGHGADMVGVIAQVRELQQIHPSAAVLIDGNGASFYFAGPARDLFDENLALQVDPTSYDVWLHPSPDREDALAAADSVIWVHWMAKPTERVFRQLPAELAAAGLSQAEQKQLGGQWQVSLYLR